MDLVEFIFTIPGVTVLLSNRICQDPLEDFFGQQRQRGRVNENPNVLEFIKNTQAMRVVNTACSTVRGNCRGTQKRKGPIEVENTPLQKKNISAHCHPAIFMSSVQGFFSVIWISGFFSVQAKKRRRQNHESLYTIQPLCCTYYC